MAKVIFYQSGKTWETEVVDGTTILQAARSAGIKIEAPCDGHGTCGKCKVKIDSATRDNVQSGVGAHLSSEEQEKGYVLSCHATVHGLVGVEVNQRPDRENVQIISGGQGVSVAIEGLISKRYDSKTNQTHVFAGDERLGSEAGDTSAFNYGVVVDIGTTTLVTALFDLSSGQELASDAALNPQSRYAQDVLSRIKYASNEQGLAVMQGELADELNRMIRQAATQADVELLYIYEIVFSGNTCMLHLATGVNPQPLGKYPYTPSVRGGNRLLAVNQGICASPMAQIYLPPIISGYVGADITSGILAAQLKDRLGLQLFVDIGTNGEMVLAHDGTLIATSTAAGPAFEGMNIECGMRAAPGAIEKFRITEAGGVEIETIVGQKPVGICGSGLIDIVGELAKNKVIRVNGKFAPTNRLPDIDERLVDRDGKTVFQLNEKVYISQKDIRQVQLAKGAIRAGIEALLARNGLKPGDVQQVLIAGSFGYHLNPDSLINIGLLPAEFEGKIEFLGNTSKTGGQAFLLSEPIRQTMADIVKDIDVLELATTDNFDKLFVSCLNFD